MERIAGRKPNVILITTDQQRYDSIGINGSSFMTTPNMDAVGQEGAVFRRAYCPNTVCTPSRVSIMTGLHLSRHGSYNIGTRPTWEGRFLSDILRAAGYRTHHIGKAHWHPWGADSPETREPDEDGRPFVDFAGFQTAELSVGHGAWGVKGHYAAWIKRKGHDPEGFAVKSVLENDYNQTGDWELPVELHSGTWAAERAEVFIREHARGRSEQPFYLNIGFQDPHHPHILPHNYNNRIDPADIPLPDIDVSDEQGTPPHVPLFRSGTLVESRFNGKFVIAGNGRGSAWGPYFQDEQKARTTRAYYYSMVQLVDEQLGRIMAALDESGLAEDTLLIFTSDHGEMLGDHGIGQKGPLFY
ncbi:MAG: arylsulfatase family protein, partial [Paenibacillaceae bacterium]|nr:arylsulfatase family protein [Paenibacillaceae bacterium]